MIQSLTAPSAEHRHRLLQGLARAVSALGYAETTIADVVREAGVSRRTFYEHFSGKPEALVALYEAASRGSLRVLEDAIDPRSDWTAQLDQALVAYLSTLAQNPVLLRTLFVEIMGLGPVGLAARRQAHEALAQFLLSVVNARRTAPALERAMALAVVGGIHELVLQAIECGRVDSLPELAPRAARMVRALARPD